MANAPKPLPGGGWSLTGTDIPIFPGHEARLQAEASVGSATATIRINTSAIAQDGAAVVRTAEITGRGIDRGLSSGAEKGVQNALRSFDQMKRGLTAILASVTAFGVASAQSVKSLEAQFRLLAGSEEAATQQLDELRKLADKTGQPFLQVVRGATALMPALRNSNAELNKTLLLTQRLAIIDPAQGVEGAAFAIREFLSGEYLSLVRRLELDRGTLKKIRDDAQGDQAAMIQGLSDYIDTLGVTEQALYDMGQTGVQAFAVLKSEAVETAADVFEPFLNDVLLPIVEGLSDMLRGLRDTNPELKKFVGIAAGIGGIAAAGQYGLPVVGKIPGGAALGKAALYGGALYGGAQAGAYIARQGNIGGVGDMTQGEVLAQVGETLKQAMGILIIGFANGVKIWIDIIYKFEEPVDAAIEQISKLGGTIEDAIEFINNLFPTNPGHPQQEVPGPTPEEIAAAMAAAFPYGPTGPAVIPGEARPSPATPSPTSTPPVSAFVAEGEGVTRVLDEAAGGFKEVGIAAGEEKSAADKAKDSVDDMTKSLLEWLTIIPETTTFADQMASVLENVGNTFQGLIAGAQGYLASQSQDLNITDELLDEWEQLQTDLADLETEYHDKEVEETEKFEERKASIIASYQDRVAEIIENAQIAYERALKSTQEREATIRADMIDRIAETDEDLAQTIADLNEKYQESEARALKDHLRRLKDIRESGEEALLNAAAHFNGRAIWDAQRTMLKRTQDEQDQYSEARAERRKQFEEALDDAQEAHDEQIAAAREAAREQIALLWDRFNKEQQMRREDTQRQLQKLQKDTNQRLAELNREHTQTLAAMQAEYGKERSAMLTHFAQSLMDQNQHLGNLRQIEEEHRRQLEQDLRDWWAENADLYLPPDLSTTTAVTSSGGGGGNLVFQHGGPVPRTGMALVHAGEHVLNPDTTRTLSRMLGTPLTQRALVGAVAGAGGNASYTLAPTITLYGGGGDDRKLLTQVRDVVTDVMMETAQKIHQMRGQAA